MLLLPILLLWVRAPLAFSLPWRWTLLSLLGSTLLSLPPASAADEVPWLVRPTAPPAPPAAAAPPPEAAPAAWPAAGEAEPAVAGGAQATVGPLQREGTPLRWAAGRFVEVGRRWAFVTADGRSYRVLENLALDRIVSAIRIDAGDDRWSVDGTITEFAGENFLLLGRVRRGTAGAAAADPLTSPSGQPTAASGKTL